MRQNVTPKRMCKDIKHELQQKTLRKENEQITMRVFSLVSCKDSFRITMALLAHYYLELYQMDVKTALLNGDLYENINMAQPKDFVVKEKECMRCRLQKSIYGLKVSLQTILFEVNEIIRKFGF